ncbi:hypothetical protein LPN04_31005 [Rugamonas sp. A1-17]|nr:hypothetical protein [Rugamonas sp. A1-17]
MRMNFGGSIANAWHDEITMLRLAIFILLPPALLVLSFGPLFIVLDRWPTLAVAYASVGVVCIGRAGFLRLQKII